MSEKQILNEPKTRRRIIDAVWKLSSDRLPNIAEMVGVSAAYIVPHAVDITIHDDIVIVDGLKLRSGQCSHGGRTTSHCCYTWSQVTSDKEGKVIRFKGKSRSEFNRLSTYFDWFYVVEKDGWLVEVFMDDTSDGTTFAGHRPPDIEAFVDRGWTVVDQYDSRNLESGLHDR